MSSKDKVAILCLNWLSDVAFFNWDEKLFQSIEPLYLKPRFRKGVKMLRVALFTERGQCWEYSDLGTTN